MKIDPHLNKVSIALYCYLNTPRALTCEIMLRYGMYSQLAELAIDPKHYLEGPWGADKFRRDAQATDFLRKSPLLPLRVDRVEKAIGTFWECEKQCHEVNLFLDLLRYPSVHESELERRLRDILLKSEKIASRILGRVPGSLPGRFGPGTSFEMKGQPYSTAADKLWITPHVTSDCRPLFEYDFWPTFWGRTRLKLGLPLPRNVRGNRFTTVPKDATKDRGICVEPLGNLWVQLGIGSYLKRRLALVGIKVQRNPRLDPIERMSASPPSDGQILHRKLAREGSFDDRWATIDLSNASDTVAIELVRWVVPPDWFELLYAARSPATLVKGKWVLLDKFSSMGNGATFELETLVFCSVLAAGLDLTVGHDLFVFGDDIVVPKDKSRDAMAILQACGLTPNMRKSFTSGPFRESCGGDFFSGFPVRSYFSKGSFRSPLEWVALHNYFKREHPGATLVLKRSVECVPSRLRLFGPDRLGDTVFHSESFRSWEQDGSRWVATIAVMPNRIPLDRWGVEFSYVLATLGVRSNGLTPRGDVLGYRITKASIS